MSKIGYKEQKDEDQIELQEQAYKCPKCGSKEDLLYQNEASLFTFLMGFFSVILFGAFSIILLPFIIEASKTLVKRCPDCYEIIEQNELFSLPSLSDQIMRFKIGNCMIVISRQYAMIIVAALTIFWIYIYANEPPVEIKDVDIHTISWISYVSACGKQIFLDNGMKAHQNFLEFKYKNIETEAIFMSFSKNFDYSHGYYDYFLFVKMDPTDSMDIYADIALGIQKNTYENFQNVINNLKTNDVFNMNATIQSMGDDNNYHVMELISIESTSKTKIITELKHFNNDKTKFRKGKIYPNQNLTIPQLPQDQNQTNLY